MDKAEYKIPLSAARVDASRRMARQQDGDPL